MSMAYCQIAIFLSTVNENRRVDVEVRFLRNEEIERLYTTQKAHDDRLDGGGFDYCGNNNNGDYDEYDNGDY